MIQHCNSSMEVLLSYFQSFALIILCLGQKGISENTEGKAPFILLYLFAFFIVFSLVIRQVYLFSLLSENTILL